jgi:hypothetical protein
MSDNFSFLPFGYQTRQSNGRGDLMGDLFYSMALPGTSSIYQDMFMRNLAMGKGGYAGFPDWFMAQDGTGGTGGTGGGTGGTGGGTGGNNTQNFGNIPKWWQDWYNASGKYGGVPPVQGLL